MPSQAISGCCSAAILYHIYEETEILKCAKNYSNFKMIVYITTNKQPQTVKWLRKWGFKKVRRGFSNHLHWHIDEVLTLWHAHPNDILDKEKQLKEKANAKAARRAKRAGVELQVGK